MRRVSGSSPRVASVDLAVYIHMAGTVRITGRQGLFKVVEQAYREEAAERRLARRAVAREPEAPQPGWP